MKSILIFFSTVATFIHAYLLIVAVGLASCDHKPQDVSPVATGYNNTEYDAINDEGMGDYKLNVSLCEPESPKNLQAEIWYVGSDTTITDAMRYVMTESFDEDGNSDGTPDPDEVFNVQARFTDSGTAYSNFQADKSFGLYVDGSKTVVVKISDENDPTLWAMYAFPAAAQTKREGSVCLVLKRQ